MSGVISPDLGLAGTGGANFNPLKRRNTPIPGEAEHGLAPATDRSTTYRMDPMMTEHLALIGFAARLGTSLTSDAAEASATRSDAQLLMDMLSSRHGHKPTTAAGIEEGIGHLPSGEVYHGSATNSDATPFAFSCPSLSIDADHQRAKRTMAAPTGRLVLASEEGAAAAGAAAMDVQDSGSSNAPKLPHPSDLFGRTLLTHHREGVSEATDVMARNVLQAFSVALEWRYSAWVGSLAKVLRLKKALILAQPRQSQGEGGHAGQGDAAEADGFDDEDLEDGYDYAEATAIDYLARTIADLSVIDVKTAFRVQQPSDRDLVQPKKRVKVRQVTLEDASGGKDNNGGRLYERSSPLTFEAVLTVLVGPNAEPMRVVLGTSGTITGTFAGSSTGAEGEEVLVGVVLKLDTDSLAHSMEEQSRLLVRAAAETAMGGGRGAPSFYATLPAAANAPTRILDLTQPSPTSVEKQHSPVPTPKPVVITPRQGNSPSSPFSSAGGAIVDRAGVEDGFTISLPVAGTPPAAPAPSTPKPTVTPTKTPAKMPSLPPTSMTRSVSESSTTFNHLNTNTSNGPSKTFLISPKPTTRDPSSLPKLVSPSPVQLAKASASGGGAGPDVGGVCGDSSSTHSDSEDSGPRAADSEWYTYQRKGAIDDGKKKKGPNLPALLSACAAISSTKA